MLIEEFGELFRHAASSCQITVSEATPLYKTAAEVLEMCLCYAFDGRHFLKTGDPVNALASFAYGFGWLDAGIYLGYLSGSSSVNMEIVSQIPDTLTEHLVEKTARYQKMLAEALSISSPAPDPETVMYCAASKIHDSAKASLSDGESAGSELVTALLFYSYGYGWLDCGVRSGLFVITGNRHLFTI